MSIFKKILPRSHSEKDSSPDAHVEREETSKGPLNLLPFRKSHKSEEKEVEEITESKPLLEKEPKVDESPKGRFLGYMRNNRTFFVVRGVFLFLSWIATALGVGIVVLSAVSIVSYPQITVVIARILTAGIALLIEGMIGALCSALCFCCKRSNAGYLMKAFLSSVTVGFELLCFSGMVLFFQPYWRSVVLVNGNLSLAFKTDYDVGGDITEMLDAHFMALKLDSVLCFIGFFVLLLSSLCAAYMIQPVNFVPQIEVIVVQISLFVASEYCFVGSWFISLEMFSKGLQFFLTTSIAIGGFINLLLSILGILNICKCGILGKLWIIARILILALLALACFALLVSVSAARSTLYSSARSDLSDDCHVTLDLSLNASDTHATFHSLLSPYPDGPAYMSLLAGTPAYCSRVSEKLSQSYGCQHKNVTGNEDVCEDPDKEAVKAMAYVSDGYARMLAYASGIMMAFVIFVILFTIFGNLYLKAKKAADALKSAGSQVMGGGGAEAADAQQTQPAPSSSHSRSFFSRFRKYSEPAPTDTSSSSSSSSASSSSSSSPDPSSVPSEPARTVVILPPPGQPVSSSSLPSPGEGEGGGGVVSNVAAAASSSSSPSAEEGGGATSVSSSGGENANEI